MKEFMPEAFSEIVVPGSTSNLGPAFDALAVALDIYMRVQVLDVLPERTGTLVTEFAGPAPAGENRIESAFRFAQVKVGAPAAGLRVRVSSDIPMTAGLGSSAAACVAGLRLYEIAAEASLDPADLLALAAELEGHPDNAAASLLGGITLSCQADNGRVIARSWSWPSSVRFIVATPDFMLHTHEARGVLPATVPLGDAVANLQRALLLVRAIETGRYEDIREALKDRWHQAVRAPLVPGLADALTIDHPSVLGVCLSGAGPSVLALAAPGRDCEAAAMLSGVYDRLGVSCTIRNLAAHEGALPRARLHPTRREETEKTA
jgi:homoserine kinase